jgi:hypothetical protein
MGAVAQGGFCSVFTTAKKYSLGLCCFELHWQELCTLVGTVAKGLICTLSAGTPEVFFACFNLNPIGRFLWNIWICHDVTLKLVYRLFKPYFAAQSNIEIPEPSQYYRGLILTCGYCAGRFVVHQPRVHD